MLTVREVAEALAVSGPPSPRSCWWWGIGVGIALLIKKFFNLSMFAAVSVGLVLVVVCVLRAFALAFEVNGPARTVWHPASPCARPCSRAYRRRQPLVGLCSRENLAWMRGPPRESRGYGSTVKGTTTKLFASFDSATKLYLSTNRMRL